MTTEMLSDGESLTPLTACRGGDYQLRILRALNALREKRGVLFKKIDNHDLLDMDTSLCVAMKWLPQHSPLRQQYWEFRLQLIDILASRGVRGYNCPGNT